MKYILLILMLLIAPVAGLEIYSYPSETSIKWNYSEYLPIVNMSFDGKEITGVNTQFGEYVSSNLHENETHFFTIYADGLYHTKQETTLSSTTEQEKTFGFINSYIFLIIVLLALVVSAWVQLAAFIALIFALLGLLNSLKTMDFNLVFLFFVGVLVSLGSIGYDRR